MAFFSSNKNNSQVANSAQSTFDPNAADPSTNQPQVQANNMVEFNSRANDTFQSNFRSNNLQLDNDLDIQVEESGLKSIKPKSGTDFGLPPLEPLADLNSSQISPQSESVFGGNPAPVMNPNNFGQFVLPQASMASNTQSDSDALQVKTYSLNEILEKAIKMNASDVHLTVGYRAIIRIDGQLKTFNSSVLTPEMVLQYVKEIVRYRKNVDLDSITELDLTYSLLDRRFRVNIFKQMTNFSIVFRVISEKIAALEELNLPVVIKEFTKFPNGLVLVTGPTGAGKSTTIASILNNINLTQSKHIITLEDPIEYVFPKALSVIDQREYGIDFLNWPNALRSVLRQDPDIVLIGEMRDLESVEAALQVADTGHLVFATLHTNSSSQTIDRIIDVFPAEKQDQIRIQLASVLRAVVAQRLVPVAQGGRMPVNEILIANAAVKNAIRDRKVFLLDNIIQTGGEEGMISMEKTLVSLVKKGMISGQLAKSLSLRPKEIDILMQR